MFGLVAVTNDTVTTATEITSGIAGIFDVVGGTPNFILFVLNGLIIVYLVAHHFWLHQIIPPPLPPRVVRQDSI